MLIVGNVKEQQATRVSGIISDDEKKHRLFRIQRSFLFVLFLCQRIFSLSSFSTDRIYKVIMSLKTCEQMNSMPIKLSLVIRREQSRCKRRRRRQISFHSNEIRLEQSTMNLYGNKLKCCKHDSFMTSIHFFLFFLFFVYSLFSL